MKKAPQILDEQFLRDKELEKKSVDRLISDFDFDEIIDSFDQDKVPESVKCFCGGENECFYWQCQL